MIDHILKKTTFSILSRRLDQDTLRHRVISHNIANVNTRGYQAKDVDFDNVLQRTSMQTHLDTTRPDHFGSSQSPIGKIVNAADKQIKNGINNVDVDEQMVALAKNQLDFDFTATQLTKLFRSLKMSIRGRQV